jgi:hypothetical protein
VHFIVYYPNANAEDIVKLFPFSPSNAIAFSASYILDTDSYDLSLSTIFYFSPQNCRKAQMIRVNSFSKNELRWYSNGFFPNKFKNFHGCSLNFGIKQDGTSTKYSIGRHGNVQSSGYNVDLVKTLADEFNFKPLFSPMSVKRKADLNLQSYPFTSKETTKLSMATPMTSYDVILMMPVAQSKTIDGKVFKVFDVISWLVLLASFIIGTIVVYVVRRGAQPLHVVFFGDDVKNFGVGKKLIWKGPVSRLILTMFILYNLIMK